MKNQPSKHYLEIMPASMLSYRHVWQRVAKDLPPGGCVLVINPKKQMQTDLARSVSRTLRQKGRDVIIWPTEAFGKPG